jgi:hypothetical protein
MGKYTDRRPEKHVEKDHTKNFASRSIGCVLMLIIPIISIAGASLTASSPVTSGYIPYQLMGYPVLPDILFKTDGLTMIFAPLGNIQNLYAIIVVGISYMVVLGSAISLIYAWIYRTLNPKRYGPFDAPPPNVRVKKYKR